MLPLDVLYEPFFFNMLISQPRWRNFPVTNKKKKKNPQPAANSASTISACPAANAAFLTPQPLTLSAGITKVAHLRLSLQLQQTQLLALELPSVLLALPPAWRAVVSSAPAATFLLVTGELFTLRQMMKVVNDPGLSPMNGL